MPQLWRVVDILRHKVSSASTHEERTVAAYRVLRRPNNRHRNLRTDISNPVQSRVHQARPYLLLIQRTSQGHRSLFDHRVRHTRGSGQERAETDTWEDVHVVALAWFVGPAC